MFDKFGEFDSAEELNLAADGFLKEGDIESLRALAEENGIDFEDAEDYINGDTSRFATAFMAAFGRMEVMKKEEIDKKESPIERMPLRVILAMLQGMCTSEEMAAGVMKKGKRISSIYDAMRSEAEKHKSGSMGVSCGTDHQLCEIIRSYFLESEEELKHKIQSLYE